MPNKKVNVVLANPIIGSYNGQFYAERGGYSLANKRWALYGEGIRRVREVPTKFIYGKRFREVFDSLVRDGVRCLDPNSMNGLNPYYSTLS
jgi:hypothetical protein